MTSTSFKENAHSQAQIMGTLTNLAYIYINHHKPKRALEYLRLANTLNGEDKSVKKMMAVAYLDAGFPRHALEIIQELEEGYETSDKDHAPMALIKSLSYHRLERLEKSQEFFKQYIQERKNMM
jgi:tetratricopeptide (TPR) repeat protein